MKRGNEETEETNKVACLSDSRALGYRPGWAEEDAPGLPPTSTDSRALGYRPGWTEDAPELPSMSAAPRVSHSAQRLRVVRVHKDAILPKRATAGSAGYDLFSIAEVHMQSGMRHTIKTGIKVEIPAGCYGRIAARSGLAMIHGMQTMAGVIDSDYRGEIGVVLVNMGDKDVVFEKGTRIAQLILERCMTPMVEEIEESDLSSTERGNGGFGSTG